MWPLVNACLVEWPLGSPKAGLVGICAWFLNYTNHTLLNPILINNKIISIHQDK